MALKINPRVGDIVRRILQKALQAFGVAAPGVVVSYNNNGTATVRIGTNRRVPSMHLDEEDGLEEFAPIQNVPVMWLAGRGIQVSPTARLAPGDPVLLVCLDRDASSWRRSGSVSDPDDAALHDWANAVAIPGLVPDSSPFTAPADASALASKVATELNAIAAAMDTIAAAVPVTNPYTAAANTPAAIKARIASTILKLEN